MIPPPSDGSSTININIAGIIQTIPLSPGNVMLRNTVKEKLQDLIHSTDRQERLVKSTKIYNEITSIGWNFISPTLENPTKPALRSRAIAAIVKEYELAITTQMNKIPLKEDVSALLENSSELIKGMFEEREYPTNYAFHTSHNVSVGSFLLPKEGAGYIIPRNNLPAAFRMTYIHLHCDRKSVDHVYFAPSADSCMYHSLGYCKYKLLPFEDIFIHKVNTKELEGLKMIERTGWTGALKSMFRFRGEMKIEEVFAFRTGSKGNLSDEDARVIRVRKDGDMRTAIFEEVDRETNIWKTSEP